MFDESEQPVTNRSGINPSVFFFGFPVANKGKEAQSSSVHNRISNFPLLFAHKIIIRIRLCVSSVYFASK